MRSSQPAPTPQEEVSGEPRPSHSSASPPPPRSTPHQAHRDERALEQGLSEFQLGLQRRLETSLRINTLILAGTAVISLAFAFNAMLMLENVFKVEAFDELITDINHQAETLKDRGDQVAKTVDDLGQAVAAQIALFSALTQDDGALSLAQARALQLARELRRGRNTVDQTAEQLRAMGGEAASLTTLLSTEREQFDLATQPGGDLHSLREGVSAFSADLQREQERLQQSELPQIQEQAQRLAAALIAQQEILHQWQQSERSLESIRERSDRLANALTLQETQGAQVESLQRQILTSLKEIGEVLAELQTGLAQEQAALNALRRQRQALEPPPKRPPAKPEPADDENPAPVAP